MAERMRGRLAQMVPIRLGYCGGINEVRHQARSSLGVELATKTCQIDAVAKLVSNGRTAEQATDETLQNQ